MRVWSICLLLLAVALPVHAGQGTIEETDDSIIVEYTGDAPGTAAAAAPAGHAEARAAAEAAEAEDGRAAARQARRRVRGERTPRQSSGSGDGQDE